MHRRIYQYIYNVYNYRRKYRWNYYSSSSHMAWITYDKVIDVQDWISKTLHATENKMVASGLTAQDRVNFLSQLLAADHLWRASHLPTPAVLPTCPSHLVSGNLGLQLLDITGGHRFILNFSVSPFYQLLEMLHFLLILFVLHHRLLGEKRNRNQFG